MKKYLTIYSKKILEPVIENRLIKIKKIKDKSYNEKIHAILEVFFLLKINFYWTLLQSSHLKKKA